MCTSQNTRLPCDAKLYSRLLFCPAVTEPRLHREVCTGILSKGILVGSGTITGVLGQYRVERLLGVALKPENRM